MHIVFIVIKILLTHVNIPEEFEQDGILRTHSQKSRLEN